MTGGTMKKKSKGEQVKPTNKFNAKKKVVDGIKFDSKAEADYYQQLKLRLRAGEIKGFGRQPKFEILPKFEKHGKKYRPITYTADFEIHHLDGSVEIVEVKGMRTKDYMLRMKLFNFQYRDLKFTEVRAR